MDPDANDEQQAKLLFDRIFVKDGDEIDPVQPEPRTNCARTSVREPKRIVESIPGRRGTDETRDEYAASDSDCRRSTLPDSITQNETASIRIQTARLNRGFGLEITEAVKQSQISNACRYTLSTPL